MKNIPKIIYLQINEHDISESTWCEDKINDNDIEYRIEEAECKEPQIIERYEGQHCKKLNLSVRKLGAK